jgi:hypothetical protein
MGGKANMSKKWIGKRINHAGLDGEDGVVTSLVKGGYLEIQLDSGVTIIEIAKNYEFWKDDGELHARLP